MAWAGRFLIFQPRAASRGAERRLANGKSTCRLLFRPDGGAKAARCTSSKSIFVIPRRPAEALRDLPFLTFLDSSMADRTLGRYSFIAADPFARIIAGVAEADWAARLKSRLAAYRTASLPGLPPFQGGVAGLFSYELGRSLERLPAPLWTRSLSRIFRLGSTT